MTAERQSEMLLSVPFLPEQIAAVKAAADLDGLTVSDWVKREVKRGLEAVPRNRDEHFWQPLGISVVGKGSAAFCAGCNELAWVTAEQWRAQGETVLALRGRWVHSREEAS